MQKYTILRDLNRTTTTTRGLSARSPSPRSATRAAPPPADFGFRTESVPEARAGGSLAAELPAPVIETTTLSDRDVQDAARDPDVQGLAVVMPTILLAPVALDADAAAADAPGDSWGIAAVGATGSPFTGMGVSVCVLDTGIDASHPAFQGVALDKRDFTTGVPGGQPIDNRPDWDRNGHGTHCAGTIFGRNVDGARIGVAPGITSAMIGKVLGDNGGGTTDMLFDGLQWAITAGVDIVSMSIGFDFPGLVEKRVQAGLSPRQAASDALVAYRANLRLFDALMAMVRVRAPFDEGTVIVAASGNESDHARNIHIAVSIPAAADGMISVGAVGQSGGKQELANFSNTMPVVCAPGVAIRSARIGGGLVPMSGTSMATPHVAGVAALWWEHLRRKSGNNKSSAADVISNMTMTARQEDVFASPFSRFDFGAGLVAVPHAVA